MCFGTAAFDTETFQRAILYQNEGHLLMARQSTSLMDTFENDNEAF